ncbi:MAG: hypothetical protein IPH12_14065 [Saprospirales bacterium]|nr:hypothetical protein [Saprospirales bacterium]
MTEPFDPNIPSVVRQNDPVLKHFPHHDFQTLRREGLAHIGQLSGKIWTDHNAHDPGITILEVLCYALLDLGYRINLPFGELMAPAAGAAQTDDNFLTPLQALTVNPVTITDYRKLLLEIEGVRNAWLIPAAQEVPLWINLQEKNLSCAATPGLRIPDQTDIPCLQALLPQQKDRNEIKLAKEAAQKTLFEHLPVQINGLYHVRIEKYPDADDQTIQNEVRALLGAHRNLCEDFAYITILCPERLGVCAEVELLPGADPEKVYAAILTRLQNFIQPEINYYTLQELLDKGRPMEAVFAGRPRLDKSYGFVDTEELENLPLREEIYFSDLYQLILSVEGVRVVQKLRVNGENGRENLGANKKWIESYCLPPEAVPVFDLSKTCIDLRNSTQTIVSYDREKVHKTIAPRKKAHLSSEGLDASLTPYNRRADLSAHYSIQNDLPKIYGIGQDGLPADAPLKRQAQAMQLKGYLVFYDQLLADYLAQLAHLRNLFSIRGESERSPEQKHTYFSQALQDVPGIQTLIRFYDQPLLGSGARIAVPVKNDNDWAHALETIKTKPRTALTVANSCEGAKGLVRQFAFSSAPQRTTYIERLRYAFEQGRVAAEVCRDKFGYFFVLSIPGLNDLILVGVQRFESISQASEAANQAKFLGTITQNFTLSTYETPPLLSHFFSLEYQPAVYLQFFEQLVEDRNTYLYRREQFLNHLLARFAEVFTDYSLLQFKRNTDVQNQLEQKIGDQSAFLSAYEDISRNRGKAYDYFKPAWNTQNVSGLEKRVALLAGIPNWNRRSLCNFEVLECWQFSLKDERGRPLLSSGKTFQSRHEMLRGARDVLARLTDATQYESLARQLNGFQVVSLRRLFAYQAAPENLVVSKYHYRLDLKDRQGRLIKTSSDAKMVSAAAAAAQRATFAAAINTQTTPPGMPAPTPMRLLEIDDLDERQFDAAGPDIRIQTIITWKWRFSATKTVQTSDKVFDDPAAAWSDFVQYGPSELLVEKFEQAKRWSMPVPALDLYLTGAYWYPDTAPASAAWKQAKLVGVNPDNYKVQFILPGTYTVELRNEQGALLAATPAVSEEKIRPEAVIAACREIFENKKAVTRYDTGQRFGFKIPDSAGTLILKSYAVYETAEAALINLNETWALGTNPSNYFLSGDEANPAYSFLLRDTTGIFLAAPPPPPFDTPGERDTALRSLTAKLRAKQAPAEVREEPRRYTWSLHDAQEQVTLAAQTDWPSEQNARDDFDQAALAAIKENRIPDLAEFIYSVEVAASPAQYRFIWFGTDRQGKPAPILISHGIYDAAATASDAYTSFMRQIPDLYLARSKQGKKSDYAFSVSETPGGRPWAVQYRDETGYQADPEVAEMYWNYAQQAHSKDPNVQSAFIEAYLAPGQAAPKSWRFLKKHDPLAVSPWHCERNASCNGAQCIDGVKAIVCNFIPSIEQPECPPGETVVCPLKDPNKFHYAVRFNTRDGKRFVLYSFKGYDSAEAALEAYRKEWFKIVELARQRDNYGEEKRIRLAEKYSLPLDPCEEAAYLAVIPDELKAVWELPDDEALADELVRLACVYPVFEDPEAARCRETCRYKFRLSAPDSVNWPACDCDSTNPGGSPGEPKCKAGYSASELSNPILKTQKDKTILESTACYNSPEEALDAYYRFLPVFQNPGSCMSYCRQGYDYTGIFEILAESPCVYQSTAAAWDDEPALDICGHCRFTGVRAFLEAAEADRNTLVFKENQYWRFRVVPPEYYVAVYTCSYNHVKQAQEDWLKTAQNYLKDEFPWATVLPQLERIEDATTGNYRLRLALLDKTGKPGTRLSSLQIFNKNASDENKNQTQDLEWLELLLHTIRQYALECQPENPGKNINVPRFAQAVSHLVEFEWASPNKEGDIQALFDLSWKFPIEKTENGYCFRIFNNKHTPLYRATSPLDPCNCGDTGVPPTQRNNCDNAYVFQSARCYPCVLMAREAFHRFQTLATSGALQPQFTSGQPYGPFWLLFNRPATGISL